MAWSLDSRITVLLVSAMYVFEVLRLSIGEGERDLRPGFSEKARTSFALSFAARILAKRMFDVLAWE